MRAQGPYHRAAYENGQPLDPAARPDQRPMAMHACNGPETPLQQGLPRSIA